MLTWTFVYGIERIRSDLSILVTKSKCCAYLHFVIPTEAYPDILPRCSGHIRVCALP
jgi:hypothetical protein